MFAARKLHKPLCISSVQKMASRHQSASNASIDGFLVADSKFQIIEVNPSLTRISGFTQQELLKMTVDGLDAEMTREKLAETELAVRTTGSFHGGLGSAPRVVHCALST